MLGQLGTQLSTSHPTRIETSLRFNFWEAGLVEGNLAPHLPDSAVFKVNIGGGGFESQWEDGGR